MPGNMRLHTRPSNEFHTDDTPPSTRPSSAASTSSTPKRSTSMDSLHTNSSSDKPSGEEFIPTRLIRAAPKVNSNAMQFVKTGPANLHKSAKEQMKKAEVVKSLRKTSLQEEEEWQSSSPSANPTTLEESTDWQTNLDKWKNSRRKRNEDVLERVIEVKKYEKEEEFSKGRRKSKTFSEMREDKDKRGRKYNFVVHDTDNNDLSDLGLNSGKNDGSSSLSDAADDAEHKDLDNDNKDTKSDAGFCTGSDTGSDGVFAEDNISDTSSALGDKKDAHDSLLDSGLPINSKESLLMNEHISITSSKSLSSPLNTNEYTYDKAIEEYKMFAENSVKKRTPSLTSLSSNASFSKEDEKTSFRSQDLSRKFDDKSSYFNRELDRDVKPVVHEPRFMRRDRTLKIDINKRRSMFELRDIDSENSEQKQINRRSIDVSDKLKTKVMSFESVSESDKKTPTLTPTRDTKFKEKLASFSHRNNVSTSLPSNALRKKTPERDQNFYKKLQSFTRLETEESSKTFTKSSTTKSSTTKSSPLKTASTRATFEQKLPSWRSPERKVSAETRAKTSSLRSGMPLKDRIASFENLSPAENRIREKSVSMECLTKNSFAEEFRPLNSSVSVLNLTRRTPSTPYMVIELDEPSEAEEICTKSKISREYSNSTAFERSSNKTEEIISPTGPPPRAPISSSTSRIPQSSLRRTSASPTRKSPSPSRVPSSPTKKTSVSSRSRSPSPSINKISVSPSALPNLNVSSTRSHPDLSTRIGQPDATSADISMPSAKRVSSSPTRASRTSSSSLVPNDLPPEVPKSPPPEIPMCPPPLYSNGYSSEDQRPTFEIQSMEMIDDFSHTQNNLDESHLKEYGDDDIDEVIDNYEHLSESVTGTELPQEHYYESTLDNMGSLPKDHLNKDLYEENMYERIHDDEPMYENIYEKVNEDVNMEPSDYPFDHQYQTLEEVKTEVESFTTPPLPPKNANSADFEVLDVTWTDESTSPLLPPSVPPPPPPPDEDDFEDGTDGEGAVPHFIPPSGSILEKEDRQARPKTSAKQELRQKMSDFLGTQPQVQEEMTLKPPPDVNEILRQERVDERLIVQKQQNLSRDLPLLDFDPLMPQPYRPRYTWEDRMKADSAKPHDMDESCDHLDFQMSKTTNDDVHALNTYRKYVKAHTYSHIEGRNVLHNTNNFSKEVADQKSLPFIGCFNDDPSINLSDKLSDVGKLNLKSLIKTSEGNIYRDLSSSDAPFSLTHLGDQNTNSIFTTNSVVCQDSYLHLDINDERNRKFASDRTISINYQAGPVLSSHNGYREAVDLNLTDTSPSQISPESKVPSKWEHLYKPSSENDYHSNLYYKNSDNYDNSTDCNEKNYYSNFKIVPSTSMPFLNVQSQNSSLMPTSSVSYISHSLPACQNESSLKVNADLPLQSKPGLSLPTSLESSNVKSNEESSSISFQGKVKNLLSSQVASVDVLPDVKIYKVSDVKSSLQNVGGPINSSDSTDKRCHPRIITIIFPPNTNDSSNSSYVIANTPVNKQHCSLGLLNRKIFTNTSEEAKAQKSPSVKSDLQHNLRINSSITAPIIGSDLNYLECREFDFDKRIVTEKECNNQTSEGKGTDSESFMEYSRMSQKLEELEQEMVKHDREMLQRIKTNDPPEERTKEPVARSQTLPDSKINYEPSNNVDLSQSDHFNQILEIERSFNSKSSKVSAEQKYANTTSNIPPPSQYGELPSVPTPQQVYSDLYYDDRNNPIVAPQPPPRQTYAPSQNGSPANLPIQEFYTAPVFNDQRSRVSNLEYQENSSFEEDSKSLQGSQFRSDVSPPKDSQPRKQSILALSAIPKPRLTDNDSWIMKKKADAGKKDYNKHWLFQEAEQRRLEQQERISRVRPPLTESSSLNNLSNTMQTTPSYQSHFQNVKSNFSQSTNNYSSSVSNGSHSPSSVYSPSNVSNISPSPYTSPNTPSPNLTKPPRSNLVSNSHSNFNANYTTNSAQPYNSNGSTNGSNNNWRKQTKTYQPEAPQPTNASKPLPESIISTLTQRVSNKNKNTLPSSKNPVFKSNYRDDNYHDYMNTEFSSSSNISLTIPQGGIAPQQQLSPAPEDHRLLSVSGKKKCSHCGEELGRGAAMIIESLRLFYHIPCFKCCVCGIQLGNGTSGADVRVRNHKLHCHNCYSNDEGMKFSKV